ncbi:MAPEG family protein [Bacteriovorax sp. BSW11_IV]|uniref:MAPEG family protein n=1 Tax=Bacteriovorax sp. BSW11_IV TaxID=1353529 RepID=UPI00038A11BD|nr:MAPEG family protein [Bacteriovorax sp. BSW11_IV]EQC48656.1 MAPEG family protein [Bacteriovorax sp. BSW11_IV]
MNQQLIYFPFLAMVLLTGFVMFFMFTRRVRDVKSKKVSIKQFKTYQSLEGSSDAAIQASRNLSNLFEAPTLFYGLCLFALALNKVDQIILVLAWAYVVLRVVHTYIHLTANNVMKRMQVFALSWIVLVVMAIKLAL